MKLYSYYRSSAAYRVRIVLHYKKIKCDYVPINLLTAEHKKNEYHLINPQQRVPTLQDGDFYLGQSLAIITYLEEKFPQPAIFPRDIQERGLANMIAQIIGCEMHPLNNLGTVKYLSHEFGFTEENTAKWYAHWFKLGFDAIDTLIEKSHGQFCMGDQLSIADVFLIPQILNAFRFKFDMQAYPRLLAINNHCLGLDYVKAASPEHQVDFVKQ